MSRAKKQDASPWAPAWMRRLFAWLWGTGRPVLFVLILVAGLGGGSYFAWQRLKPKIISAPEYQVAAQQVEITPLPPWIHSDVRAEVFRDPRLDGPLSILNDDLLDRLKDAFSQHPWIAKVTRVVKHYPAQVKIDLVYRRPVCMVDVPGGVLAVDAEGCVLPSDDFSPVEAARYPRLIGVDRNPTGPVGKVWSDARVVGGAEIAASLASVWDSMKLYRILPLDSDAALAPAGTDSGRRSAEPLFVLLTRSGTRVIWGYAPGANMLGELSAAEKVARLQQYVADHDSLDDPQGQRKELDVRVMGRR